jgi:hypothetical protein
VTLEPGTEPYLILHMHGMSWEALWWAPKRSGYTVDLEKAGRYTREEAEEQASVRNSDRAVPLSLAMSLSRLTVDRDTLLGRMRSMAAAAAGEVPQ